MYSTCALAAMHLLYAAITTFKESVQLTFAEQLYQDKGIIFRIDS